jgi:hypothetical protein
MGLVSPRRALGLTVGITLLFALGNAMWMRLAWSPRLLGDGLRLSLLLPLGLGLLWAGTARPATAAAGAFVTSLLTSGGFLVGYLLPNPQRATWCAAPGSYCEDGIVAIAGPLLGIGAGALAAAIAAGLAMLLRRRAQFKESFLPRSSR